MNPNTKNEQEENPNGCSTPESPQRTIARLNARVMLVGQTSDSLLELAQLRARMLEDALADIELAGRENAENADTTEFWAKEFRVGNLGLHQVFYEINRRFQEAVIQLNQIKESYLASETRKAVASGMMLAPAPIANIIEGFMCGMERVREGLLGFTEADKQPKALYFCETCKRHVAPEDTRSTRRGVLIHDPGCGNEVKFAIPESEEWVMLKPGDELRPGDQWSAGGDWEDVSGHTLGNPVEATNVLQYRRQAILAD